MCDLQPVEEIFALKLYINQDLAVGFYSVEFN